MRAVFDDHAGRDNAALIADALVSLFRQWVLRPPHREALVANAVERGSGIPAFQILEDFRPSRTACALGSLLSLVVFGGLAFSIGRGGNLPHLLIASKHPRPAVLPVDRASIAEAEPTTHVRVRPTETDPLFPLADAYFEIIRVLAVLDADRDRILSPWEIMGAPVALRRLDADHDGKLSAEECGFFAGDRPGAPLNPELVEGARLAFMGRNPVLAALDTDQDGYISAREIGKSSGALKNLDRNGDGNLAAAEVIPDPNGSRVAMILLRLDRNADGSLSAGERASQSAGPLREFLDKADRNRDGVTTADELRGEFQLHDDLTRQREKAPGRRPPYK